MDGIFADNAMRYYENGYSVLPIEPNSKAVKIPNWQQHCDTRQPPWHIQTWLDIYENHNVGIALGNASQLIALDFDDDIDGLHEEVQKLLQGSLVKKKGRKGFTAFYRYNGERTKRWRKDGKTVVELLSKGTQTVVPPSMHPDTKKPYFWLTEDTLLDIKADELTKLPVDFIEQVDRLFGYEQKVMDFKSNYSGENPDLAEVEKMLSFIPSSDYATWITVGMALQHNYGDSAYSIWDAWSCKAPNYQDKGMQYKWVSFGNSTDTPVTVGTIFHMAIGHGYIIQHEPEIILPADFKLTAGGIDLVTGEVVEEEKTATENTSVGIPTDHGNDGCLEFPQHLLDHAPGLPGEIAAWINSTALYRQPILALGAAICASGTLFAHRICSKSNLRTNFMVLGLAESGTGKNHARECIKSLFHSVDLKHQTLGKFASDSGLVNALDKNKGIGLALIDEIGREIASLNTKGAGSHETRLLTTMMEMYSEAGTYYDGKRYANSEDIKKLIQPCLNIYGTTVPKRFFDSMTSDESVDGFLARWLIFESKDIDPPMQEKGSLDNIPETLLNNIERIVGMPIKQETTKHGRILEYPEPNPTMIKYTDGAEDILHQFSIVCNENRLAEIRKGGLLAPIWARSREHAIKLALVAHPYREDKPQIESVTMEWACDLALYLSQVAIKAIEDNVADSEHEKTMNKVKAVIERWCKRNPGEWMSHRKLCNYIRFIKSRELNEILQQLYDSDMIKRDIKKNKSGSTSPIYKSK